jgi:hypothetical protein
MRLVFVMNLAGVFAVTNKRKKALVAVVILAGLASIALFCWPILRRASASEYRTFQSPDGKYRLVVYRMPEFSRIMPGQAGDAPGYIRLYDRSGHVLAETDVVMVQIADRVTWEKDKVNVWLVAEWNLPN